MKKAQKAQAKKARKDAERAKRIEEDGETTDTAAQAPRARPAWQLNDDKPTVSVARRGSSAQELELAGTSIVAFSSIIGRVDRHGRTLTQTVVESCVSGCIDAPLAATPTVCSAARCCTLSTLLQPIQAECWSWAIQPIPPDIIAISPTGSGKTLAFLLPALAELMQHLALPDAAAQPTTAIQMAEQQVKAYPSLLVVRTLRC